MGDLEGVLNDVSQQLVISIISAGAQYIHTPDFTIRLESNGNATTLSYRDRGMEMTFYEPKPRIMYKYSPADHERVLRIIEEIEDSVLADVLKSQIREQARKTDPVREINILLGSFKGAAALIVAHAREAK